MRVSVGIVFRRSCLAAILLGLACSHDSAIGPGPVVTLRVDPHTLGLDVGDTGRVRAFPLDARNTFVTNQTILWSSSPTSIATVDQSGLVTGRAIGTAVVYAQFESLRDSAVVTVDIPAAIALTATADTFTAIVAGGNPPAQTVDVTNGGGRTLSGLAVQSITYGAGASGWLSATLSAAVAPSVLTLQPTTGALAPGSYSATVTIASNVATNSPQTVTVTFNVVLGPPAQIAVQAGEGQSGTVADTLAVRPAVIVRNVNNFPLPGVSVTFAVASGGGSLAGGSPQIQTTDANGVATAAPWTLGTVAGANTLTATATGTGITGNPVTFHATGLAASAGKIFIVGGTSGNSATVNTAVATNPAALVTDNLGNPVQGVQVTFAVASGGGSLTGGSPQIQTTGANGIATAGTWTLGTTAGANTVTGTASGLLGSPLTFTATGTAGAVASISRNSVSPQTARVGTAVATPPSVIVRDQFNNPVPSATVTWSVPAGGGGGSVNVGTGGTSNGSGIATVTSWTLGNATAPSGGAYPNSLNATSNGFTATFTGSAIYTLSGDVQPIFDLTNGGCTSSSCHGGSTLPDLRATATPGSIVGVTSNPALLCSGRIYVVAGDAVNSLLQQKVDTTAGCGNPMPLGPHPGFTVLQREIIRQWINNGAQNN